MEKDGINYFPSDLNSRVTMVTIGLDEPHTHPTLVHLAFKEHLAKWQQIETRFKTYPKLDKLLARFRILAHLNWLVVA